MDGGSYHWKARRGKDKRNLSLQNKGLTESASVMKSYPHRSEFVSHCLVRCLAGTVCSDLRIGRIGETAALAPFYSTQRTHLTMCIRVCSVKQGEWLAVRLFTAMLSCRPLYSRRRQHAEMDRPANFVIDKSHNGTYTVF